jgi:hypothetical protein
LDDKGSLKTGKTAFQAAYLFTKGCSQNIAHKDSSPKNKQREISRCLFNQHG